MELFAFIDDRVFVYRVCRSILQTYSPAWRISIDIFYVWFVRLVAITQPAVLPFERPYGTKSKKLSLPPRCVEFRFFERAESLHYLNCSYVMGNRVRRRVCVCRVGSLLLK